MPALRLGVIADDFTGGTDIAAMIARAGLSVTQVLGVPSDDDLERLEVDAVVVALKTRSVLAAEAVEASLAAWQALATRGVAQGYFKYCSTFDSTSEGNIGPVADALARVAGTDLVPHLPALPENGRTVYQGHLFVRDRLLNESGMEKHPLNPMTDANLVRWLGLQTSSPVVLVPMATVMAGAAAVRVAMAALGVEGSTSHVIGDAISEGDLDTWAEALQDQPLVAGGSGLAASLARRIAKLGGVARNIADQTSSPHQGGRPVLILAGSCSASTLAQIARFQAEGGATLRLDPSELDAEPSLLDDAISWASTTTPHRPAMIYTSGTAAETRQAQDRLGTAQAAALAESALSKVAVALTERHGALSLIVAGGETSGAVVGALGVRQLRIGAEIDPGIPWTTAFDAKGQPLGSIALKSGNFGAPDFFKKAVAMAAGS